MKKIVINFLIDQQLEFLRNLPHKMLNFFGFAIGFFSFTIFCCCGVCMAKKKYYFVADFSFEIEFFVTFFCSQ